MEWRAQSTGVEIKARVSKLTSECRTTKAARGTTRGKTKGKYLNSPPYIGNPKQTDEGDDGRKDAKPKTRNLKPDRDRRGDDGPNPKPETLDPKSTRGRRTDRP